VQDKTINTILINSDLGTIDKLMMGAKIKNN